MQVNQIGFRAVCGRLDRPQSDLHLEIHSGRVMLAAIPTSVPKMEPQAAQPNTLPEETV